MILVTGATGNVGSEAARLLAARHQPTRALVRGPARAPHGDIDIATGDDVAAVCRELGVSEQTYHRWRNQFGGLKADDAKRLKDLEQVRTWLGSDRALRTKPMAL